MQQAPGPELLQFQINALCYDAIVVPTTLAVSATLTGKRTRPSGRASYSSQRIAEEHGHVLLVGSGREAAYIDTACMAGSLL